MEIKSAMVYISPQVTLVYLAPEDFIAVSIEGSSEGFTDFGDSAEKIIFGDAFEW